MPSLEDPPLLRLLLANAGGDRENETLIRKAWACLEGTAGSPLVMNSVLLSAIGQAILRRLNDLNPSRQPESTRPERRWARRAATAGIAAAIALVAFAFGSMLTWIHMHADTDAKITTRIEEAFRREPEALRPQLLLEAHGGSLRVGRVKTLDGQVHDSLILDYGDLPEAQKLNEHAAFVPLHQ
jgi:hypothetical protein